MDTHNKAKKQPETDDICLFEPDEANSQPDEAALNNITLNLVQIDKLNRQTKRACVYDDRFIGIQFYDYRSPKNYWVNLLSLDFKPQRQRNIKWLWVVTFLGLFNLAFITVYLDLNTTLLPNVPYMLSVAVALFTLSFLSLLILRRNYKDTISFYTMHGQIPLVELIYNQPTKAEFHDFIVALSNKIQTLKKATYFDQSQQLAAELAEHRRLRNDGIISQELYQTAKKRIFSQHGG